MKRIELAAPGTCSFCFEPILARAFVYLQDNCTVECAACHAQAERVKVVRERKTKSDEQQDLFGGGKP